MNNYKNNSGWILCPSKRFPGKFYYYNVLNGESAWSFNDTEKKLFKIDDKTHVSQRSHRYPEPASPPDKNLYGFTKNHPASTQTFGHAVFPKYISSENIKWTSNLTTIKSNKPSIRHIDTQTYSPEIDILVGSSKEPLSQQFPKYELNKSKTKNLFPTKVYEPTIDNGYDRTDDLWNGGILRKSILNIFKQPETISTKRKYVDNSVLSKNSVPNENPFIKNHTENLTLTEEGKLENKTITSAIFAIEANQKNLDRNDLRYILQAKRSKLNSNRTDVDLPPTGRKKEVRFDIENSEEEDRISTKIVNEYNQKPAGENNKNVDIRQKFDFKIMKVTTKYETHNNLFLQSAQEVRPFILDDKERSLDANLKDTIKHKEGKAFTELSRDQMKSKLFFEFRNNTDYIVTDDDDDLTEIITSIKNKLHVKKPRNTELFTTENRIKSKNEDNPFKCTRSKTRIANDSLSNRKRNKSGITISIRNSNINDEAFVNNENNHFQITKNKNILDSEFFSFDTQKTNPFSILPNVSNFYSTSRSKFSQNDTSNVPKSNKRTEIAHGVKSNRHKDEVEKNEYSVEDKLGFDTRNKTIKEHVVLRMDELICWFTQIMEDFIYNTIETSSCPPPYSFCEAFLYLREMYAHYTNVVEAVDRIIELDIFCPKTGYMQHNIQPQEIIKAIGYGLDLVDAFKEFQDCEVQDTKNALLQLLEEIEEPKWLDMPEPTVSVTKGYTDSGRRQNFIKSRSEILLYLQKHFLEWRSYEEPQQNYRLTDKYLHKIGDNKIVLRTSGKNLHLFKINSKNQLSVDEVHKKIDEQKGDDAKVMRKFKTIDKFETRVNESHLKNKSIFDVEDESEKAWHLKRNKYANDDKNNDKLNAENSKKNCKNEKEINKTTNDAWNKHQRYGDHLTNTISEISEDRFNESYKTHNVHPVSKDNSEIKNIEKSIVNEDNDSLLNIKDQKFETINLIDDENNSNCLKIDEAKDISDNGSQQCYELLKHFLIKLSATLQLIYSFIEESLYRLREGDVKEDYKKALYEETNNTYIHLKNIIETLKSIIEREAKDENALKILMVSADAALSDKRVTRYKQVMSKCLEQARLMENSLKILLNLTDDNCSLSVSSDLLVTTYTNIFE